MKTIHYNNAMESFISENDWQQMCQEHESDSSCTAPSLYISTFGKYLNGSLAGLWADLSTFSSADEFFEFCRLLHADDRCGEWMFQDFENLPRAWYSESMGRDEIERLIEFAGLDEENRQIWEAYVELKGDDVSLEDARDAYAGEWDSEEDFAENLLDEICTLDDFARRYFDVEAFARDIFINDYTYYDGKVFRN